MQHYPHGTLGGYLKTRSHMTEVGLHKVTLDVARGLGYIHQNQLVHNGLTTETVYMASLSGVRVCWGWGVSGVETQSGLYRGGGVPDLLCCGWDVLLM